MDPHPDNDGLSDCIPQTQADEPTPLRPHSALRPSLSEPAGAGLEIIRATRTWIQYGTIGFAVALIVIGGLEGLLGW